MRLRFFSPRIYIGCILGLCLTLVLHACQTPQTPPTAPQTQQSSEQPLPPETAAIVNSAGPGGIVNPERGDVRLVVISDLNSVYGATDYDPEVDKGIALLPFWKPDMVVCSGDMVAGQRPTLSEAQIKAMWAAFDDHVAAPLRRAKLPYGFTIGNHDASGAVGVKGTFLFQNERDLASAYWNEPDHDPGIKFIDKFEFPFYYTFEYKDIFLWLGMVPLIASPRISWNG